MKAIETTTRKRFSDASLTALLTIAFENLHARIKLKAAQLGATNLPLLIGDTMKSYWAALHHEYQGLLDTINLTLEYQVTCFEVSENDKLAETQLRELEHKLSDAEHELIPVQNEVERTPCPAKRFSVMQAWVCIAVVASLDSLQNIKCFQLLGNSYLEAIGIGISFSGVLVIFAHFVPRLINIGKTAIQQRIIAGTIFLSMTAVFWHLGQLRSDYLNTNSANGVHYSPWFFTVLSLFLFTTAIFIYIDSMPSKADREAIERYNALLSRHQHMKDKIQELTEQIATARADKIAFRVDNSSIVMHGNMLEKRAIHEAYKGFATLKDELLKHRTDHGKPDCFDNEYPFTFQRYFDQID